jgi:adenylate cyclase
MSDPLLRDAMRLIQDIVIDVKGSGLDREGMRRLEAVLKRSLLKDGTASLDSGFSQREASVLFADLRGFSALAASYSPKIVLGALSRCFGMMAEIAVRHYGTVDKFMGDAIMVLFHGENPSARDHAQRSVLCAVEMQIAMNGLREQHRRDGLPEVYLGIGISTGNVMTGLIGSDAYRAYTAIGEEVNVAARIEALSLRGQVLISEATYAHCEPFVSAGVSTDVYVKGKGVAIRVREVLGIPELGKFVPRQDMRKSPRAPVALHMEYLTLTGKIVDATASPGMIRDIGYHGLLAETAQPLAIHGEVKLAFDLPGVAFRAAEIYARVVSIRQQGGNYLAGLEFTSLSAETSDKIQRFVQMSLQGELSTIGSATSA